MAVRIFPGARYVPIFPKDWDAETAYEELSAVQVNGFTYLSKCPVPAGVPIDNEDFWLLWADPNAQMEQLRQAVLTYDGRISANTDLINDAMSQTNTQIVATENPVYYGADPTGATDSSQAIADCIAANGGGSVRFPGGVYKISRAIEVPYATSVTCSIYGNGAVFMADDDLAYFLKIGSNKGSNPEHTAGAGRHYFHDMTVISGEHMIDTAIAVSWGYKDANISGIYVYKCKNGVHFGADFEGGTARKMPADGVIENSLFYGYANAAPGFGFKALTTDNYMSNCRLYRFNEGVVLQGTSTIEQTHIYVTAIGAALADHLETVGVTVSGGGGRFTDCYIDGYYKGIKIDTTNAVHFEQLIFFNPNAALPLRAIESNVSAPVITVVNSNFRFSASASENTGFVNSVAMSKESARIVLKDNVITNQNALSPFDILAANASQPQPSINISAEPDTWYAFGIQHNAIGTSGANASKADVIGPGRYLEVGLSKNVAGAPSAGKVGYIYGAATGTVTLGIAAITNPLTKLTCNVYCFKHSQSAATNYNFHLQSLEAPIPISGFFGNVWGVGENIMQAVPLATIDPSATIALELEL